MEVRGFRLSVDWNETARDSASASTVESNGNGVECNGCSCCKFCASADGRPDTYVSFLEDPFSELEFVSCSQVAASSGFSNVESADSVCKSSKKGK